MTCRLGIIGTGRVAQEHARAAIAVGSKLVCVCDTDEKRAQEFAQKYSCPRVCTSLEAALGANVDALVVAVPNALHRSVAIECLRAGKDILLEKPMAMSVAECDEIIAAMNEADRMVQMGFVCRSAPKVEAVRELVASGALGTVYHIKASMYRQRGIPGLGRWFTTKDLSGGGVLIDIGVHLIDLALHLTGAKRATTVSAACESRFGHPIAGYIYEEMWAGPPDPDGVFDVEDSAMGFVRFDSGATLELNVAWACNLPRGLMPEGIFLLGDRGGCFFDLWGDAFIVTSEGGNGLVETNVEFDNAQAWNRAWDGQHERFRKAVQREDVPLASAGAGRAVQAIVDAMYVSSADRREVRLEAAW